MEVTDSTRILPYVELGATDICVSADPFVFKSQGVWNLLLQEDHRAGLEDHEGICGYTIRNAPSIEGLAQAPSQPLLVLPQSAQLHQAWAAEIHFEKYLYVSISNGNNSTHRMHVYETLGNMLGPWKHLGSIKTQDDYWAIDMSFIDIPTSEGTKTYAVWSGWATRVEEAEYKDMWANFISQNIYIAELHSPTEIGKRHLLAVPNEGWNSSVAPILEGPQGITINGKFRGLLVTGNASWTPSYATGILKYRGGNPLDSNSWSLSKKPLFIDGYGIGHGMFVEEDAEIYYVGHRKTSTTHGWDSRAVFYCKMNEESLENYLKNIH